MLMHLSSWPEIDARLKSTKTVVVPIGSNEQHGPTGLLEARGELGHARVPEAATDTEAASRLWNVSETLAGVHYPSAAAE